MPAYFSAICVRLASVLRRTSASGALHVDLTWFGSPQAPHFIVNLDFFLSAVHPPMPRPPCHFRSARKALTVVLESAVSDFAETSASRFCAWCMMLPITLLPDRMKSVSKALMTHCLAWPYCPTLERPRIMTRASTWG
jgi:hypothetical protein